jgi:hypothetical protein
VKIPVLGAVFLLFLAMAHGEEQTKALRVSIVQENFNFTANCRSYSSGSLTYQVKGDPTTAGLYSMAVSVSSAQVNAASFTTGSSRKAEGVGSATEIIRQFDQNNQPVYKTIVGTAKWTVRESGATASFSLDFTPKADDPNKDLAVDANETIDAKKVFMYVGTGPVVDVRSAYMSGPTKLTVQIGRLHQDEGRVRVFLIDNRIPNPIRGLWKDLRAQYVYGRAYDDLEFDLAELGVKRFSDTFSGSVSVELTSPLTTSQATYRSLLIRIPIVLVPGIFNGNGGLAKVQPAPDLLYDLDTAYFKLGNTLGNYYSIDPRYPTVGAVEYVTSSETLKSAATKVALKVNAMLAATYSDRCIIVAHSKGSLVSRQYVQSIDKGKRVKLIAMLGGPHAGSAAAVMAHNNVAAPAVLALLNQLGSNLINLFPTDPALWSGKAWTLTNPINTELQALNALPWPKATFPIVAYTDSVATPALLDAKGEKIMANGGLVGGDRVVPYWSAMGMGFNPKTKSTYYLKCFDPFQGGTIPMQIRITMSGAVPHSGMWGSTDIWKQLKFWLGILL